MIRLNSCHSDLKRTLNKTKNVLLNSAPCFITQESIQRNIFVFPPGSPSSPLSSSQDVCAEASLSSKEEQGLMVLVSVITSCLQTLHSCDSKLASLELVLHLAPRLSVDILLDRISPYLLHFCNDSVPRVRAQAVRTLAKVLALVKEVPRNDVNIYPEYILPGIAHLAQDDATIVRLAYAGERWTGSC